MRGTSPTSGILETSIGNCGWNIHLPYGPSESHSRTAKEFARRIRVANLGASDAEPVVCPRGMGSLQGAHGPLVEVRAANVQAFDTVSLATQNALFPDWWMNEGGQSATGEVRVSTPRAHVVAHNRLSDSAS